MFVAVAEKVSTLCGPVAADVAAGRTSGPADPSQSYPGEGQAQEPPEPRALVRKLPENVSKERLLQCTAHVWS